MKLKLLGAIYPSLALRWRKPDMSKYRELPVYWNCANRDPGAAHNDVWYY